MKIMYIDCAAGISGSALLGALVDLGIEQNSLSAQIKNYTGEDKFELSFKKTFIKGVASTFVVLEVPDDEQTVPIIKFTGKIFKKDDPGDPIVDGLAKVYIKYAAARSKLLNIPIEEVTEKKRVLRQTSIISAGTFAALKQLNVHRVIASPIPIYCKNPESPETETDPFILELARGARIRQTIYRNCTNTALGVALLSANTDQYGQMPEIYIDKIGYGAIIDDGKEGAAVRVLAGTDQEIKKTVYGEEETIMVVETSIDDMNPEFFPYLIDRLLNLGALDAFLTPIYMKKGRPANLLTVLCREETLEHALTAIFREATTLGVRIREEQRRVLRRKFFEVSTPFGEVSIKTGFLGQNKEPVQIAPEFEDCKQIAIKLSVPIKDVYAAALRAAFEKSKKPGS